MALDLVSGHDRDAGQVLAVAEQERAGDTVGVVEGVVMQEAGQQRPAVVAVDGCPGRPAKCGHQQRGAVVVFGGPAEEVPDRVAREPAGQPAVDVGLPGSAEGEPWLVEPVQEAAGGQELGAGVAGGCPRRRVAGGSAAQAAQDPPGGVGVQQPAMLGGCEVGDQRGDPGLQPGQGLVPGGTRRWRPGRGAGSRRRVPADGCPAPGGCRPARQRRCRRAAVHRLRSAASSTRCAAWLCW